MINQIKVLLTALSLLGFSAASQATLITENITGFISSGPFAGSPASGSFTYQDDTLTFMGDEFLNGSALSIDFTIFSQTFDETDDTDFPGFPELAFSDGEIISLNFFVENNINNPSINNFSLFELIPLAGGGFDAEVVVQVIPVPASAWLFASGLIGLIGISRRKG